MIDRELPASLRATPPGPDYAAPATFALEQERLFERLWMCAIRAADIPAAGDYRTVTLGRENVIIVRGGDGEIRAFLNACRHRGARLCDADSGSTGRHFRCPYHAWTYGLDGKLVAAPNLAAMRDIDRDEWGLLDVPAHVWQGYVWVNLGPDPADFETEVVGQIVAGLGEVQLLDAYAIDTLAVGRRIVYDVRANWKLIVENFMECYHCAHIHPELTAVLPEFAGGYAAQAAVGHGAQFGETVQGFTVDGTLGAGRLGTIGDAQDRRYYAATLRPTVFVNLVPDHVIWHRMFPLAPDRTVVECDWLFAPETLAAGHDIGPSVELFHRVNEQDFEACERCQPNMTSRAYAFGGVLAPAEHHIGAFHAWLADYLSAPRISR